jgi:hypothetical protein
VVVEGIEPEAPMEVLPLLIPVVPPELLEPAVVPGSLVGAPEVEPGVAGEAPMVVPELPLVALSVDAGAVADGVVVEGMGVELVDGLLVLLLLLSTGVGSGVRLHAASEMPAAIIRATAVLRWRVVAFMGTPWGCEEKGSGGKRDERLFAQRLRHGLQLALALDQPHGQGIEVALGLPQRRKQPFLLEPAELLDTIAQRVQAGVVVGVVGLQRHQLRHQFLRAVVPVRGLVDPSVIAQRVTHQRVQKLVLQPQVNRQRQADLLGQRLPTGRVVRRDRTVLRELAAHGFMVGRKQGQGIERSGHRKSSLSLEGPLLVRRGGRDVGAGNPPL